MTTLCEPICTDRPQDDACMPCSAAMDPIQFNLAWDLAERMIHESLGRRFGVCIDSIEACVGACCACACTCDQCARFKIVIHDRMPIREIVSATVTPHPTEAEPNPIPVPINGLTIVNYNEITWPRDTKCMPEGIINITFTYGQPWPPGICSAVRDLAAQIVAAMSCDCECSLPNRVQSYVKGDISYSFIPAETLYELKMTGIASLDAILRVYGSRKRPTIYSPDIHRAECLRWYRTTGV